MTYLRCITLALLALALASPGALALDPPDEPTPEEQPAEEPKDDAKDADKDEKGDEDAEDEEEEEEEPDRFLAITGGTVHTITDGTLSGVTILCKNGTIDRIGRHVKIPEEAESIDATGLHIYPGIVAADSTGILGNASPADSADVFGLTLNLALASGITTVVSDNTAAKLTWGTLDGMVVKDNVFETLRYSSSDPSGKRRIDEAFEAIRTYMRELEQYERDKQDDPDAEAPDDAPIKGGNAKYYKLMKGEAVALVRADNATEMVQAANLAERYGFKLVIRGAVEGWTIPSYLARAKADCIISPRQTQDPDPYAAEPTGSSIENAKILHDHGIRLAIIPGPGMFGGGTGISLSGLAGRDLAHINMEAAFAVRGGLSNDDALETITIDSAKIIGVDHRVGSIEVGKDADFAITDGDLLHYMTHVRYTVVNGELVYDKFDNSLYSHIRTDNPEDEARDHWPRSLGEDW